MPAGGLQITKKQFGSSVTGSSISPMPVQRQVPPWRQKGTSAPTRVASSRRVSMGRFAPYMLFKARSTAAASVLPPPMPALLGMRLWMTMLRPSSFSPVFRKKYWAAR